MIDTRRPQPFGDAARPLRSMLFVPGHKPTWVDKAVAASPDAIVLDLEDAVPAQDRADARVAVRESVARLAEAGTPCFVRVNSWGQGGALLLDLEAVVQPGLAGVVLPKVGNAQDIESLALLLGEFEAIRGIGRPLEIVPLCETAEGLVNRLDIYRASPRVRRAPSGVFGSPNGDAARSIGLIQTPEGDETTYVLGRAILEARAAGLVGAMGGMCTSVHDLAEVERVARRSRRFGANGALAIHPTHVAVLHEVYSPTEQEISEAADMVAAFASQIRSGEPEAAINHAGRMVDIAHLHTALQLFSDALRQGRVEGAAATAEDHELVSNWVMNR